MNEGLASPPVGGQRRDSSTTAPCYYRIAEPTGEQSSRSATKVGKMAWHKNPSNSNTVDPPVTHNQGHSTTARHLVELHQYGFSPIIRFLIFKCRYQSNILILLRNVYLGFFDLLPEALVLSHRVADNQLQSSHQFSCKYIRCVHGHANLAPFSLTGRLLPAAISAFIWRGKLAVPSGSSPQSSCIQGCRYSAALLYACRGHTSRPPVVWVYM